MVDHAGEVDGGLDAGVTATDDGDVLALEQWAVAVRAEGDTLIAVLFLARHAHEAPVRAGGDDDLAGLEGGVLAEVDGAELAILARSQAGCGLCLDDVDLVVVDVRLEVRREGLAIGLRDGAVVLDGLGVQHLAAEALTDEADAQALTGDVDRGGRACRALTYDEDVVGLLLIELRGLALGVTVVEAGDEVLDVHAAGGELLAIEVDGRDGLDALLVDFVLEEGAFHCGVLDPRVDDGHRVQCLHHGRAVLAGQGHVGSELEVPVQGCDLVDEVLLFLDRVTADLEEGQHQGAELVAHRDAREGDADVAACTLNGEGRLALVQFVVLAGGDVIGECCDVLEQLLEVCGLAAVVEGVNELDLLGDAVDQLAELGLQVVI